MSRPQVLAECRLCSWRRGSVSVEQSENDRQTGPRTPDLVAQIDKSHVIACRNLRAEVERCLAVVGRETMRQIVAGWAKRFSDTAEATDPTHDPE